MTSFATHTEPIPVHTMGGPAADPKWKFTDAEGHEHRAYPGDSDKPTWPTLKWVVDETYWCGDCQDTHENGHWECVICGESIEPGMVMTGPQTLMRPGRTTREINDVPVTDEVWDKAMAIHRRAEDEIDALVREASGHVGFGPE